MKNTLLISFPAAPGRYQACPSQWRLISISKPLCFTELRASSAKELCGSLYIWYVVQLWIDNATIDYETYVCSDRVFFQQRFLSIAKPGQRLETNTTYEWLITFVKWNWRGSSVLKETFNPVLKKSGNGFLSYVKKRALLLKGLIAMPICFR